MLSHLCTCAEEQVDAGDLSLAVSYRGFPIYTETKDLCDQTECPVKKGPVKVDLEQPFPIITPPVRLPVSSTLAVKTICKEFQRGFMLVHML